MRVLAFGGGTDSTGLLGGWVEYDLVEAEPIDLILFADTGGERPSTYVHIAKAWQVADSGNRQILRKAFTPLLKSYKQFIESSKAQS